jgi:gamma-glutamylcyclotransferase (GGCT)/AIG2-like uncharacterized protein YtfP
MTQTRFLFVYGSLRPGSAAHFGRAMRRRLEADSQFAGPATLAGELVSLGRYPGLVDVDSGARVQGELVELTAPDEAWSWLDAYEGINPEQPERSEYDRVVRDAISATGEVRDAWVYVLRRRPARAVVIASGDWLVG